MTALAITPQPSPRECAQYSVEALPRIADASTSSAGLPYPQAVRTLATVPHYPFRPESATPSMTCF